MFRDQFPSLWISARNGGIAEEEQIQNFPSTLRTNRGMFPLRSGREVMRRQERPLPLVAHESPMRTYLITYDLASPARHSLSGAIMQLGEAWARPLDTTWYVQSF